MGRSKKRLLIPFLIASISLTATASSASAFAAHAKWIMPQFQNPNYYNPDPFYKEAVVAYPAGTTASLVVQVSNYYYYNGSNVRINVTVGVQPDWLSSYQAYNSSEATWASVYTLAYGDTHLFTISFIIPPTSIASNLVPHDWNVLVAILNSTTPGNNKHTVFTERDPSWYFGPWRLAVLSEDQSTAESLLQNATNQFAAYPSDFFKAAVAISLHSQAFLHGNPYCCSRAYSAYSTGDFATAKAEFTTAMDLFSQAVATELAARAATDKANMSQIDASTNAMNAETYRAAGWVFLGVGGLLVGIASIWYAGRKA